MKKEETNELQLLKEYFNWVVKFPPNTESNWGNSIAFRGHSRECKKIKPSVFRDDYNEVEILKKAKYHACEKLRECCTDLEKLIMLQHYELKTRLLDFTFNPFVALYFACCNKNEWNVDGEVLCVTGFCVAENVAQLIAEYVFSYDIEKLDFKVISKLAKKYDIKKRDRKALMDLLERPQFFYPAYNNSRIKMQKGFFMIGPLISEVTESGYSTDKGRTFNLDNPKKYGFQIHRFIIKKDLKEQYLKALSYIGIDESSIFPEFDHLMHSLNENFPPMIGNCNL